MQGTDTSECPVAEITPRSYEIVQDFTTAERIDVSIGELCGWNSEDGWPGWAVDAARILETERGRFENARLKAENETR